MNNRIFAKTNIKPRRTLSSDFTNQTMVRVAAIAGQRHPGNLKGIFTMSSLHLTRTTALASTATAIILGGTAFAAIHWAGWTGVGNYTDVIKLPNGNIRLTVDARSSADTKDNKCVDASKQYFEIKAGSPLTPPQLADMATAACEYTDVTALFPGIQLGGTWPSGIPGDSAHYQDAEESAQTNDQYYMVSGTVENVSATNITIKFSNLDGNQTETLPLAANSKVYDNGQLVTLSNLRTGDAVQLVLTAKATYARVSALSLDRQNPNHTIPGSSVYGILKLHHQLFDLSEQGKEYTPLVPAQGDPNMLVQEYPLQ